MSIEAIGVCNPQSFYYEARHQRVCAVCGTTRGFQAHHVVTKQELARLGLSGDDLYDSANALRLCQTHHLRHHGGIRRVRTAELKDLNIRYAFHVLGAFAADWLRRYYDDTDGDPRIIKLES